MTTKTTRDSNYGESATIKTTRVYKLKIYQAK